jgi:hypothetical protein
MRGDGGEIIQYTLDVLNIDRGLLLGMLFNLKKDKKLSKKRSIFERRNEKVKWVKKTISPCTSSHSYVMNLTWRSPLPGQNELAYHEGWMVSG